MTNQYHIAIVDDHKVFRKGLRTILNKIRNVNVVAEAENGKEFLEIYAKTPEINMVFMDISMPGMDGIQTTKLAKEKCSDLKIIALSSYEDQEHLNLMLLAGANGYILKTADLPEFEKAIHKVGQGKPYFSDDILDNLTEKVFYQPSKKEKLPEFSSREIEIMQLLCQGLSNKKIGDILHISDRTVERHKTNLLQKTTTENTLNLVIYAIRHKIVIVE